LSRDEAAGCEREKCLQRPKKKTEAENQKIPGSGFGHGGKGNGTGGTVLKGRIVGKGDWGGSISLKQNTI